MSTKSSTFAASKLVVYESFYILFKHPAYAVLPQWPTLEKLLSCRRATDYDWNKGGGALRNSLIQLELLRTQQPQGSGFKTFYYGYGSIRTK